MHRPLLALSCALALTGCFGSRNPERVSSLPLPPPPAALLEPCLPTPRVANPDGSMTSAQTERNLGMGDVDLAACEAKRKLAVDSWPKRPVARQQGQ